MDFTQPSLLSLEPSPQQVMPERELWAAVMDRAIEDLFTIHVLHWRERAGVKREVLEWFRSKDETEGSFRFVCDVLNVSPSAVRRAILQRRPVKTSGLPTAGTRAQQYG